MNKKILYLFFHPYPSRSRANRRILNRVKGLPNVEVRDLYELYPDFHIDVKAEQAALLRNDVIVFQHPFYWYNCPPLMKMWLDDVLEPGFAYDEDGDKLEGKHWLQVMTTGGPAAAYSDDGYNHFTIEDLLRPFEQTAYLCGMIPLKPVTFHSVGRMSEEELDRHALDVETLMVRMSGGEMPQAYCTATECEDSLKLLTSPEARAEPHDQGGAA